MQQVVGKYEQLAREVNLASKTFQNLVFAGPSVLCAVNEVDFNSDSVTIAALFSTNNEGKSLRFGKLLQRGWIIIPDDYRL